MSQETKKELFKELRKNQRLLAQELHRRGVDITILVKELELIEARYADHYELILDRACSNTLYSSSVISSEKYLTKVLLQRAGLSVPEGSQFYADQLNDALAFAERLRTPLVIKPAIGSGGKDCYTDLEEKSEFEEAIGKIVNEIGPKQAFVIEEQQRGEEFRVFVTENGNCAVLRREPAFVIGDGKHNIAELAELESFRRMNPHINCLLPLIIDKDVEALLQRLGLTLQSIPSKDDKVYLRRIPSLGTGGFCEDLTDEVHPSFTEVAMAAMRSIHGLSFAGIDILSIDAMQEQSPETYAILEVNSNPGLYLHMAPGAGQPRDVVSMLADLIFPETK